MLLPHIIPVYTILILDSVNTEHMIYFDN